MEGEIGGSGVRVLVQEGGHDGRVLEDQASGA